MGKWVLGDTKKDMGLDRPGKEHGCGLADPPRETGVLESRGQGPALYPVLGLWRPDAWIHLVFSCKSMTVPESKLRQGVISTSTHLLAACGGLQSSTFSCVTPCCL